MCVYACVLLVHFICGFESQNAIARVGIFSQLAGIQSALEHASLLRQQTSDSNERIERGRHLGLGVCIRMHVKRRSYFRFRPCARV